MNKENIKHQLNRVMVQSNHIKRIFEGQKGFASILILLREIEALKKLIHE